MAPTRGSDIQHQNTFSAPRLFFITTAFHKNRSDLHRGVSLPSRPNTREHTRIVHSKRRAPRKPFERDRGSETCTVGVSSLAASVHTIVKYVSFYKQTHGAEENLRRVFSHHPHPLLSCTFLLHILVSHHPDAFSTSLPPSTPFYRFLGVQHSSPLVCRTTQIT